MMAGARRSAAVNEPLSTSRLQDRLLAFWQRRRYWIIGFALFLLLDLVLALGIAGSAGHF